jgi:hypothetical protein
MKLSLLIQKHLSKLGRKSKLKKQNGDYETLVLMYLQNAAKNEGYMQ